VSVLVTVYNREAFLKDCLASILESDFAEFEIVIVDDCSTDQSARIGQECAAGDSRVHFYQNPSNLGDYPNRNRAAKYARGRYLKYLDADDRIYSYTLRSMVQAMDKWQDAALGLSWNVIDPPKPFPFVSTPREVYGSHFLGTSILGVGPSAAILRRESFEAVGGFTEEPFIGDADLWLRLSALWPVVSFPPSLVWWRRHPDQQMTLELSRPAVLSKRYWMERNALENTQLLSPTEKEVAIGRLNFRQSRRLARLAVKEGHLRDAARLWRECDFGIREAMSAVLGPGKQGPVADRWTSG